MIVQVLYIAGAGRSGSTLLARLLGDLEGFAPAGELRYLFERGIVSDHLCGCGAPFRSCPFWNAVLTRAYGGVDCVDGAAASRGAAAIDRIRYIPMLAAAKLRPPAFAARLREHGDLLARLYAAIGDETGGRVVVDSSKDPSYAYLLKTVPGVDLRIVHLVRDSRAVAHSWTRTKVRPEVHREVTYMRRVRPVRSALLWNETNALFDALARTNTPTLRIRYEDLVADTDGVLAGVIALSGRPAQSRQAAQPMHDISGNPLRFAGVPPKVRLDDEWRTALPPADRRRVTALTAPLLWRYGYRTMLS